MRLHARLNRVAVKLQPAEDDRVIIYNVHTDTCSGGQNWKPGMPHKGVVILNDVPRTAPRNP